MASGRLGSAFWRLWAATSATNLGDGISLTAFPLLAVQLTDDARLVAAVTVARFLPFVLVGLPVGIVVDRHDRRLLLVGAQLTRAVVIAAVGVVVASGTASIPVLMLAAFAVGTGEIVVDSSIPALVRAVVRPEQLEVANSRQAAAQTVTNMFLGPPLGAALFTIGAALPFAAIVVTFVVGVALLGGVDGSFRPPADTADDDLGLRTRLSAGVRHVWRDPVLRPLALTVMVFAFVGEAVNAVFVLLVTERLGLSDLAFGLLISLDATTSIAVSFAVAPLVALVGHAGSMRISIVAFSLSALLLGTTTVLAGVILAVVLGGVSDPTWNVVSHTIRQRLVPDEVFGRVMTAYLFIAWSAQPVGALLGGVIAEAWGPQVVYLAAAPIIAALLVGARPMFAAVRTAMPRPT